MGKNHFPGSGSVVTLVEGGTVYNGSFDPAANVKGRLPRRPGDRRPTTAEIKEQESRDERERRREERSFVSMCATADVAGKLSDRYPVVPAALGLQVKRAGGIRSWLVATADRQRLFRESREKAARRGAKTPTSWRKV